MSHQQIFKSLRSTALVACFGFAGVVCADDESASVGDWGKFKVGSAIVDLELAGTLGEWRPMPVLLFYPADEAAYESASPMVYNSRLHGKSIDRDNPDRWVPMSYVVIAERARQGVAIDRGGPKFPLIVYSHPARSDPQNAAPTLERLASHGYVIAAP